MATTVGVKCNNNNNDKKSTTRAWYGIENDMEQKFRYGIWKMPKWNEMEDFKNGLEDNLSCFHTNFILDFVHCIYRKIHIDVG